MRSIPKRGRFRLALAGTLGGLALAAGAGVAYATAGTEAVETGYAVEVAAETSDCPDTTGTPIESTDR